jgi:hypothetical protein
LSLNNTFSMAIIRRQNYECLTNEWLMLRLLLTIFGVLSLICSPVKGIDQVIYVVLKKFLNWS